MIAEEFWRRVRRVGADECWLWIGGAHKGYGRYGGKAAHRVAYQIVKGSIPAGLELDHLCKTPLCVNPRHLEPVTRAENMRRRYAEMTHCKNGHEFTEDNTYTWSGWRTCRTCRQEAVRRYQERKAA